MRNTKAATLTEYGLILALMSAVAIGILLGMGGSLTGAFQNSDAAIAAGTQGANGNGNGQGGGNNGGGQGNGGETPPPPPPPPGDPLIFSVETDTGAMRLSLSHKSTYPEVTVDWGGPSSCPTTVTALSVINCGYAAPGVYTIQMTGEIDSFNVIRASTVINDWAPDWDVWKTEASTDGPPNNPAIFGTTRLVSVVDWGDSNLRNLGYTFAYAMEPYTVPAQLPPSVEHLSSTFYAAGWISPTVASWDTSNVKTMMYTFASSGVFFNDAFAEPTAPNLSGWNVSNVINFRGMFANAVGFNQDISGWDVSSGVNFYEMFTHASSFAADISGWNMAGARDLTLMFNSNTNFNAPIGNWAINNPTSLMMFMGNMPNFNQDLSGWCVSAIATEPMSFQGNNPSWSLPKPNWGAPC
jgi:Flp pilus assembly pilin Flp